MSGLRILAAASLLLFLFATPFGSGQWVSHSTYLASDQPIFLRNPSRSEQLASTSPTLGQPIQSRVLAGLGTLESFKATQLWDEIWNTTSRDSLLNYTQKLSQNYPGRVWYEQTKTPSVSLRNAWTWANETLMNNTAGRLAFHQVTDHKALLAIKSGIGPAPRHAILVTGVISSGSTPGANEVGSSVAAVLELARVLDNYTLYCDVYYVLASRDAGNPTTDLGARDFVAWLNSTNVETITSISFERILFDDLILLYGTKISLRSYLGSTMYQDSGWIRDLLLDLSMSRGASRLQYVTDQTVAQRSMAYELWQAGRPAIHVSQGYWNDAFHDTPSDVWGNSGYSYDKAKEATACAACVVAYIGMLGGKAASFNVTSSLNPLDHVSERLVLTYKGFVNATVSWTGNTTVFATISDAYSHQIVYQRTEDDGLLLMKYLSKYQGRFNLTVTNVGSNATLAKVAVTFLNDIDGDGLSDTCETGIGTDPYSTDTDKDGLADNIELTIGTSPTNPDTDGDGASDGQEIAQGSSPFIQDTDGDGLLDGVEIALGTDPTKPDTDGDRLSDGAEMNIYKTDPLRAETDGDGLDDGLEVALGLNPLSPDTDGDGLGDMFEIVNGLDPKSKDTDGDGLSDAYEVEFCLSPTNPDTDFDGLPDSIDWNPREHWIVTVAPATLLTAFMLFLVYAFLKYRVYKQKGTAV